MDVIASQKNATLERVEWKYRDEEARGAMLTVAMEKAKKKAEQVASLLGVKLLGVYDFIETTMDEELPYRSMEMGVMQTARSAAPAAPPHLSMEIQHNKTIQVNVDIWYRVSTFEANAH